MDVVVEGVGDLLPRRLPKHFEQAADSVDEAAVAEGVVCVPDPAPYVEQIAKYREAGFDELFVNQIGPDLDGFLRFFTSEVQPRLPGAAAA